MTPAKLISPLILIIVCNSQFVSAMGSQVTPELIDFCKKAGGTPKVFSSTMTDTCDNYKKKKAKGSSLTAGQALTAGCDCGPQKCLQNDQCIVNPD
jgi:hypothetical protein